MQKVGRAQLHDHRQPDGLRSPGRLGPAGHQHVVAHGDAVGGQDLLGLVLGQGPSRLQEGPSPAGRRRGTGGHGVERRLVAQAEGVVVEVGPHGPHAVPEGAEHGHLRVEEHVLVGGVVLHGRAPDDADGLVRRLGDVHQVLGQGFAHGGQRSGDGTDDQVHVGVGHQSVQDLASPPVRRRWPTVVDGVGDPQVARDPLVQLALGLPGEGREAQPGGGGHVGHVGAGPTRDGVDAHSVSQTEGAGGVGAGRLGPGQHGRGVEELVEAVHPGDTELAEHGGDDGVGASEVPGVGLGHGPALVRPPHLHGHDGHTPPGGVVGGQHQRPPVLEALDVPGHHADLGLVGEVGREVGELQVHLVACGRPVRHGDAQVLALEDGSSLVPALGDEGDGGPGQVVAEGLEGVEIGVGPQEVDVAAGDELGHLGLEALTLPAHLGESGGEDDGELGLLLDGPLQGPHRVPGQDDGQVDVAGNIGQARKAGQAVDLGPVGVDGMEGGTGCLGPGPHLAGHGRVGPPRSVGGADDGHRPGTEEHVQVDGAKGDGSPGDVELTGISRHGPSRGFVGEG